MADDPQKQDTGTALNNYFAYQSPEALADLMRTQARMGMAQALYQQGMAGMPAPNQMAGNVVVRNSPMSGLANLLGTYTGSRALTGTGPGNLPDQYVSAQNRLMSSILQGNEQPSQQTQAFAQAPAPQTVAQGTPLGNPPTGMQIAPQSGGGAYNMGGGPTPQTAAVATQQAPVNPMQPTDQDLARLSGQPVGMVTMLRISQSPSYYALLKQYFEAMPPEVKQAGWAGSSAPAAAAAGLAKATTMTARPGGYVGNPTQGFTQLPTSEGTQNFIGPDGRWHSGVTPEAPNVQSALQYAQQAGRTAGTMNTGVDKFGQPTYMWPTPPANPFLPGGPPAARPQAAPQPPVPAPTRTTATAPAQSSVWTPPYGGTSGIRPAMSAQETGDLDLGRKYLDNARTDASNVGLYRELLKTAQGLASDPNNKFGPGSQTVARLKAQASNIPGVDLTGAQTAQDVLSKVQSQIVSSQLGPTGTDRQLENLLHGVPGGEMTNQAMLQVIPMIQSQLDLKENRAMFAQRIADSTKLQQNVPSALTTYNRLADPATVSLGKQLAAATQSGQIKQFVATLTPAQRALLPRVQQLDHLGAF